SSPKGLIFLATSVVGQFTKNYYKLLAKEHANKNLLTSPLALEIALNMVYVGAKDNTANELKKVLDAADDTTFVTGKYNAFFQVLETRETTVALDIANGIYVNDKNPVAPEFSKTMQESFRSQAVGISLGNADKAASIVNDWVKKQTHGRITDTVASKDVDPSLQILLVNAFAFKGAWVFKFSTLKTRVENFHSASGKVTPIKMMSQMGFYKAADLPDLDAKVLQLRYHKSSLSMFIFLPNKPNGLSELEEKISEASYQNLDSRQVQIKLPKFKIQFTTELVSVLKKVTPIDNSNILRNFLQAFLFLCLQLGIANAFDASANFENLVQAKGTPISKVIQKGVIEISEDGSGVASILGIRESFIKNQRIPAAMVFKATHPFAYVVRDEKTIYFQGHYVNPE
ncbi:hypothetical protein KR038_010057, partial [Drosophila bunnanda]